MRARSLSVNGIEREFCTEQAIEVDEWMQDIGSGLNYKRKQFIRLFELVEQGRVKTILIAHRDRLVRFGFEWFEAFCERHGTQIIKLNNEKLSPEREMVEDLIAVVTTIRPVSPLVGGTGLIFIWCFFYLSSCPRYAKKSPPLSSTPLKPLCSLLSSLHVRC